MTDSEFQFFDVGRGYIQHWIHGTTHWEIEAKYRYSAHGVLAAFNRLIEKRDLVGAARRLIIANREPEKNQERREEQQAFFDAVHDFYQTYYSTLSALNGLITRFRHELGEVPHSGNEKFLKWLAPKAIGGQVTMLLLHRAREYRTFLDHPAQHQPYDWAVVESSDGLVSIALHGAAGRKGQIPADSVRITSLQQLEGVLSPSSDWVVLAPDENKVLTALAVQMNTIFPQLNGALTKRETLDACEWELILGPDEPQGGYPVLAAEDGVVVSKRDFKPGSSFGL